MAFRGLAHALNLNANFQLFGERVHHFHWCVKKFLPEAHDVKSWADDVIEKGCTQGIRKAHGLKTTLYGGQSLEVMP